MLLARVSGYPVVWVQLGHRGQKVKEEIHETGEASLGQVRGSPFLLQSNVDLQGALAVTENDVSLFLSFDMCKSLFSFPLHAPTFLFAVPWAGERSLQDLLLPLHPCRTSH